ncbi:MAG: ABC transporter permease [Flammeovirgaceae bacterium]|nr:ABC transporter permease [Flammeovirgaceae bacterium]
MQKSTRQKKNLGSYPSVGVIISITLALFVTGLFGVLIMYSQQFESLVRENIKLQVYLRNGLSETQRQQIEKKLEAMPYTSKGKDEIQFISRDEAAKKFIAETGEDFTKFIGDNPLHDAFLISLDPAFHQDERIKIIKTELEKMNGIFQVYYNEGVIETVNKNVRNIGLALMGLIIVLLITVILLINNTIRLALFSQRFLIRSMQLVGAKRWFIQRPFLLRAGLYGIIAGVLAIMCIYSLLRYANTKIQDLTLLYNQNQFYILAASLAVIGMTVAIASTYYSIRKYLRMSLDELY